MFHYVVQRMSIFTYEIGSRLFLVVFSHKTTLYVLYIYIYIYIYIMYIIYIYIYICKYITYL